MNLSTAEMLLLMRNEFVLHIANAHICVPVSIPLGNSTDVVWILMGLFSERSKTGDATDC